MTIALIIAGVLSATAILAVAILLRALDISRDNEREALRLLRELHDRRYT